MTEIDELLDRAEAILGEGPEAGESPTGWAFRAHRAEWFMKRAQIAMRRCSRVSPSSSPRSGASAASHQMIFRTSRREPSRER